MGFLLRGANWPVEWPLVAIVDAGLLYALGGRFAARPSRWRSAAFYSGLATLVLAIDSPVDAYADTLFWVHMVQHVLLMMVAPPLLLLGRPWPRLTRALPLDVRRPLARAVLTGSALSPLRRAAVALASPLPAFALFNGVLVVWHVPYLFDLTLRSTLVHDLEHTLFFGTGLLFWLHLTPPGARRRLSDAQRVAYGTGAILVSWGLAVVLGFASHPLYGAYAALAHRPGGISALADQHLAAGVMWVPASIPFTIAVLVAAYRLLDQSSPRRTLTTEDLRPRET
jgi:cytochrome c oxidase assembly factor CtaG